VPPALARRSRTSWMDDMGVRDVVGRLSYFVVLD